jgi:hypothetical protein
LAQASTAARLEEGGGGHLSRLSATGTVDKYQFAGFVECQFTDRPRCSLRPDLAIGSAREAKPLDVTGVTQPAASARLDLPGWSAYQRS